MFSDICNGFLSRNVRNWSQNNFVYRNDHNASVTIASYVEKPCYRDDPKLEQCMIEVGNKVIKKTLQGDSKYRIPKLEPLIIPEIRIRQGTPQVGVTMVCTNCALSGLEEAKFTKVRTEMTERWADWYFSLDQLRMYGKYNVSGKVLLLPIKGEGDANIIMKDIKFIYSFKWDLFDKANKLTYLKVNNFTIKHEVGGLTMKLENLFNGDNLLGENMNRFLNENWKELVTEMGPAVAEALGNIFTTILNAMSDVVPYDNMFPKMPK